MVPVRISGKGEFPQDSRNPETVEYGRYVGMNCTQFTCSNQVSEDCIEELVYFRNKIQVVDRPFWYCGWVEMRMRGDQVFPLLSVVQEVSARQAKHCVK